MELSRFVTLAARAFELAGVSAMLLGAMLALVRVVMRARVLTARQSYRQLRQSLGAAILLGLELLVAADIIRTVTEAPSLREVLVLGLIVLVRTFLSFTLEVELEGRWPWQGVPQHDREHAADPHDEPEPPSAPH